MAAFIYLATPDALDKRIPEVPGLLLDSTPEYWFLYRYFEAANINRQHELIDLYGGAVIEGYQLHRLRTELEQARADVETKPETWNVLVGWNGEVASIDTEDWRALQRRSAVAIIDALLNMIQLAQTNDLKLVSSGD